MTADSFAAQLQNARKHSGLTQKELAARCGLSPLTVCRYETGERLPNRQTLEKITAVVGSAAELTDAWLKEVRRPEAEDRPRLSPETAEAVQLFEQLDRKHQNALLDLLRLTAEGMKK